MMILSPMILAHAAFEAADKTLRCMAIDNPRRPAAICLRSAMLAQMLDVAERLGR
ncbi:MAG: hypothetical protein IPQ23_22360 [Cytophagaceae bacterium]|nr:hypothetical protein [Cytophagaceae bacterium]